MYNLLKVATIFLLSVIIFILINKLIPPLVLPNLSYSTEILDSSAERLRLYTTKDGYWRLPIQISEIDKNFIQFLLSFEDQRFYYHNGIDWLAMFRALGQAMISGRFISGGSTISMQTVRLLHPKPRTLFSKIIELIHALKLEYCLTKQQILTLYLTLAPYGGNIQGIRAASWFYFGKEPIFLNTAEASLLLALPQAPEARRPDRAVVRARIARSKVLQRLVISELITPHEAIQAAAAPIPRTRRPTPRLAPHFTDRVRAANPNAQLLRTTLNIRLQRQLETILKHHQPQQTTGVTIAAIVVENRTWAVRAYAGSADYFAVKFIGQLDMVRAVRSPGSVLKPFIYGLAFEAGIVHPETLIFDRPGAINGYAPGNFDRTFQGEISIRHALRASRNIPVIKIFNRLNPNLLLQRLVNVNINLRFPPNLTRPGLPLALGGVGIRLEDLVRLYIGLANGGVIKELRLLENTQLSTSSATILSPAATWYITDILSTSQPPPGFTLNKQRLAFKTGTSYGFRDAWAIGYNATHTVAVWLGRPDNGYTANLSGLHSAVPIMLEILDQLPKSGLVSLLRSPPPEVILTQNSALPSKLRHFDYRADITPITVDHNNELKILYPPSNSIVELTTYATNTVYIEISGGHAPFHILENGRPIYTSNDRQNLAWIPTTNGIIHLSVLDAKGYSDRVQLQITKN